MSGEEPQLPALPGALLLGRPAGEGGGQGSPHSPSPPLRLPARHRGHFGVCATSQQPVARSLLGGRFLVGARVDLKAKPSCLKNLICFRNTHAQSEPQRQAPTTLTGVCLCPHAPGGTRFPCLLERPRLCVLSSENSRECVSEHIF